MTGATAPRGPMREIRFAGDIVMRPGEAQLLIEGRPAQLGGRAFEVLCALAEKPGQLVTKRELIDRVWPDVVVEENNLQVQISTLRRLLGPASIITVAGRGYRLVPQRNSEATLPAEGEALETQPLPVPSVEPPAAPAGPLLERQEALSALATAMDSALKGQGAVCLVYGEAGIGKSSLCNAFVAGLRSVRVLRGSCEALFSPRPLGPLYDFVGQLDAAARGLIGLADARAELFAHVLDSLQGQPTVLLLEDLHWADAATLDLVKYLGRRIQRAPVLLVLTYRDDELSNQHPLRLVLGDLQQAVTRISLQALSEAAVEELAWQAGRPADGILAITGGNPFYVTELLEEGGLPATVRDAVRARVARQPAPVRALLELISTAPGRIEHWIVEMLVDPDGVAVQEALSSGLLLSDGESLRFRHELARRAVEQGIAPYQLRRLHARMLDCLLANSGRSIAPARLVHHAKAAGRAADVLKYAPQAAEEASKGGAHREGAALYASALEVAESVAPEVRAAMLEARAWECHMSNQMSDALSCYEQALQIWQASGRVLDQGRVMSRISRTLWYVGRGAECSRVGRDAAALLQDFSDSLEYVEALVEISRNAMLASRYPDAIETGSRALALAEQRGNERLVAQLLINIGTSRLAIGEIARGQAMLERSLAIALKNRDEDATPRAYINLICLLVDYRMYERAEQLFEESAKAFFIRYDVDLWENYSTGWRARTHLERGRWREAEEDAMRVLSRQHPSASVTITIPSLLVMARLKAARGDPEVDALLGRVIELAAGTEEPQRIVPAAIVRCEALWLRSEELGQASSQVRSAFERSRQVGTQYYVDELGYWLWLHGVPAAGVAAASPRGLQVAGRWREAAAAWARLGCPLEQGQALLQGDAPAIAQAEKIFERLGATAYLNRARSAPTWPSALSST
jgi:DNA-binding winged helix-turn-helix (wHTH) protein/tetratricopeptide (TPR) repeat protein